jgi:DNA-binding response OmpR family regulator
MGDILIVDDDQAIATFIAEALHDEGYVTRIAYTSADALASIASARPSLIVLDLHIPGNGVVVLERVRQSGAGLPVVVTSAMTAPPDVMALGATTFLAKPFQINDLLACVARYVPPA